MDKLLRRLSEGVLMATLTPLHTGQYRTENTTAGILIPGEYSDLSFEYSSRQTDVFIKKKLKLSRECLEVFFLVIFHNGNIFPDAAAIFFLLFINTPLAFFEEVKSLGRDFRKK